MSLVARYPSVSQTDQAASPLHDLRVMSGKDESRTGGAIKSFHHVEKRDRGGRVQIRRRLVCQDKCRFRHHRSGDSHSLLLPAGEFSRTTIFEARETYLPKQLFDLFFTLARRHALKKQSKFRILQRGKDGQQVIGLENEADTLQAHTSQFTRG